jgi:hypothetical protein
MVRKIVLLACFCLLSLNLVAADKAGYALLDTFVAFFKNMAATGSGGYEKVDRAFQDMMAQAKKAKNDGTIDLVFYKRFTRLLAVFKLSIIPDPQIILGPIVNKQISKFIEDITGEERVEGKGIGPFANAIAEELINLRLYLDTQQQREELMKKFLGEFGPAKK